MFTSLHSILPLQSDISINRFFTKNGLTQKVAIVALLILSGLAAILLAYRFYCLKKEISHPSPAANPHPSSPIQEIFDLSRKTSILFDKIEIVGKTELKEQPPSKTSLAFIEEDKIEMGKTEPKQHSLSDTPPLFLQIDQICAQITDNIFTNPHFSAEKAFSAVSPEDQKQIKELVDEIIAEYEKRNGIEPHEKIAYGEPIPAHYANDPQKKEEPPEKRIYYALAGMRNLFMFGPPSVDGFRDKQFIGGEHHYKDTGLETIRIFTGGTVDLDTPIDATNDAEAIKEAKKLIINFGKLYGMKDPQNGKLTAEDVIKYFPKKRNLHLPNFPKEKVHPSTDHNDRSNHGIWKREKQYYVNVPDHHGVLAAILKTPYLLAELVYRTKQAYNGKLPKEFFDQFFKEGVSDGCYNAKLFALREFYFKWLAKLAPSPEVVAREKISQGKFGEALKIKGADHVIADALTLDKLVILLDNGQGQDPHQFKSEFVKGSSYKEWIKEEEQGVIEFLKKRGLWESVLYQGHKEDDFLLLNQTTLQAFLKDYADL